MRKPEVWTAKQLKDWSWGWTINFGKKTKIDRLILYDKDNNVVYDGKWTYDRQKTCEDDRFFPTPKEIDFQPWWKLVRKDLRAEIETDEIVDALKENKDE